MYEVQHSWHTMFMRFVYLLTGSMEMRRKISCWRKHGTRKKGNAFSKALFHSHPPPLSFCVVSCCVYVEALPMSRDCLFLHWCLFIWIVCLCICDCMYMNLCLCICDCMYVNLSFVESQGGGMWYVLESTKSRSGSSWPRKSMGRNEVRHCSSSLPFSLSPLRIADFPLQV